MRYARLLLQFCLKLGLPNWVDYLGWLTRDVLGCYFGLVCGCLDKEQLALGC
jgi:hypothetical protein